MRVVIVPNDNAVFIDGFMYLVDLAELREQGVHAVQWYGEFGEVEYTTAWRPDEGRHHREPNKPISSLEEFQKYIDAWMECRKRAEAVRGEREKELQLELEAQAKRLEPPKKDKRK